MFQDPDLELARSLDLRKDVAQDAGAIPGQQAPNGGLPGEVPGEAVPGSDAVPVDPSMINDDGTVVPVDPDQPVQQLDEQGQPIDPAQIGPDGQPLAFPDQGTPVDQNGQPFQPGPNMPMEPGDPEGPESPVTEQAEGVDPDALPEEMAGDPGTPNDGVPDLQCPNCGFTADAAQPTSVNMDDQAAPNVSSDGMVAGDVCPNCQQAQLVSVGEMDSGQAPPPPGPTPSPSAPSDD